MAVVLKSVPAINQQNEKIVANVTKAALNFINISQNPPTSVSFPVKHKSIQFTGVHTKKVYTH